MAVKLDRLSAVVYNIFVYTYFVMEVPHMKKVKISWKVKKVSNTARVNTMYCFKSCEKNQN